MPDFQVGDKVLIDGWREAEVVAYSLDYEGGISSFKLRIESMWSTRKVERWYRASIVEKVVSRA